MLSAQGLLTMVRARLDSTESIYTAHVSPLDSERQAYIARMRDQLSSIVSTPRRCEVVVDEFCSEMLQRMPGRYPVWLIAINAEEALFFEESVSSFGKASIVGTNPLELLDVGVRSDDPLDAYLA